MGKIVKKKYSLLNHYKQYLRRNFKSILFDCPICEENVRPEDYEDHCDTRHGKNSKTQCIWCFGQISWKKGKKYENMDHVYRCAQKLLINTIRDSTPTHSSSQSITVFDNTPQYRKKCFYGHVPLHPLNSSDVVELFDVPVEHLLTHKLPPFVFRPTDASMDYIPDEYNNDFYSMETVTKMNRLTFENENINAAVYCVRYFLETHRNGNSFHHVMVRRPAFSSLWKAMTEHDFDRSKIFPFYCWCDGGDFDEPQFRQHIHMIVVSRRSHFMKKVWPHVTPSEKPSSSYKCKYSKWITSPLYLAHTIGYVSKRQSRCRFGKSLSRFSRDLHFYFAITLPKDFIYCLITQWNDGIRQYIENKYQNLSPQYGEEGLIKDRMDGRWKIQYKYLNDLPRDLVLPVKSNLLPVDYITDIFLCLNDGRKIYFEEQNESRVVSSIEQAARGNMFFENVGDNYLNHRPKMQTLLNKIDTSVMTAMEIQNRNFKETLREKNAEIQDLKEALQEKNAEINRLTHEEINRLKETVKTGEAKMREKDYEMARLRTRIEQVMNARIDELQMASLHRDVST